MRSGRPAPEIWSEPPGGGGPRGGGDDLLLYDNGAPLDDYGDPASQLSLAAGVWQFIAAAADDFTLVDQVSPDTNYRITMVRGAFTFFNVPTGEDPTPLTYWDGVDVTVYADAPQGWPNEEPLQNGGHTNYNGGPVAAQFVIKADLLYEELAGSCHPCYIVDIPVNFVLAKNTRYWLSLVPRFNAPPQSAWCLSILNGQDLPARQGASFGITWWTQIDGNYGCPSATGCPAACTGVSNPPAGTNQDLSFQLYGWEVPPNEGACCHQAAGTCVDVQDPNDCTEPYYVFHSGTACALLDPPCDAPVSGACCTESSGTCVDEIRIDLCPPGSDRRFAPNTLCTQLQPPCGTGVGACCFQDGHCELKVPAACEYAGGTWHQGDCSAPCPPPNDDCANAPVLSGNVFLPFSTAGATTDGPGVSGTGCTDVNLDIWFKYAATCTGNLSVSLCYGTTYDSAIAVYNACTCPVTASDRIACNDNGCGGGSELTVPVVEGRCYLIRVGGAGVATGSGFLAISCLPPGVGACCLPLGGCDLLDLAACNAVGGEFHLAQPCSPLLCPPPNDDCANARRIGNGAYRFATFGATTDGPPVSGPGCTDVNQDIWFDYEASCDGDVVVALCRDTPYNAALAVYAGWACSPLGSQVACNNDACGPGGPAGVVIPSVTTGTRFKIRVGGFAGAVGPGTLIMGCLPPNVGACCLTNGSCVEKTQPECDVVSGTFHPGEPCSPLICPPPNDDCADAITITNGSYDFDTRGATTDGPEDSPGGHCINVHRDIWYKYTAMCNGRLVVSLCGTADYDSAVAIYQGCTACPPTLLVGCDNDGCEAGGASVASADVTSGTCYLIRVGGAGESSGTGTLAAGCLPPNTGACCHADYTCAIALQAQCAAAGDTFNLGQPCSDITCPPPTGACCFLNGGCQVTGPDECPAANGNYRGNGTTCTPNQCTQPAECCVGDANGDGVLNGNDIGPFSELLLDPPSFGTIQFCWANVNDSDWVVDLADVPPFVQRLLDAPSCGPQPTGACCFGDGACQVVTHGQCAFAGGAYQGDASTCSPSPCPQPPAACCFYDGHCEVLGDAACAAAGGTYQGAGTSCTPNSCAPPPPVCCPGDLTGDGAIATLDIEPMVDALLTPPPIGSVQFCRADVNEDLAVNGLDIQPFVQLLLSGATCQPGNDECTNPTPLTGSTVAISYNTQHATTAAPNPITQCGAVVQDIWYSYLVPCTGRVVIRTVGSAYDTALAVYGPGTTGCPDNSLCPTQDNTEIACSDDVATGLTWSMVSVPASLGNCLLIRVGGKNLGQGVSGGAGVLSIDCLPAGRGACCHLDGTCTDDVLAAGCAAPGDIFSEGQVCTAITCPAIPINDECAGAVSIPCNSQVTVQNTSATQNTADPAFSCRFGGAGQGVGTVWFKFTAAGTSARISTCGSAAPVTDTLLAVYNAASCASLTSANEIACNDDAGGNCQRLAELCVEGLTPGATYYVQAASYDNASRGLVTLSVTCPCPSGGCCFSNGSCQVLTAQSCSTAGGAYQGDATVCDPNPCPPPQPPINDVCTGAVFLACGMLVSVDNTYATTDPSDPAFTCHAGGAAQGVGTVWYKFVAAGTSAQVSTCGSALPVNDTLVAVYDGSCPLMAGSELACNEDAWGPSCGRLAKVCATGLMPGNMYYIQVASSSGSSRGVITVNIACPCP